MSLDISAWLVLGVFMLLQLAGVTFAAMVDTYISRHHRFIMLMVVALILSLTAQDALDSYFSSFSDMGFARTLTSLYGYSIRPVIIVLFILVIDPKARQKVLWALVAVNAAIHATSLFSGICFHFSEQNDFQRGPLGFTSHVISGILLLVLAVHTVKVFRGTRKREIVLPILNILLIVAAVVADSLVSGSNYISYLDITMATCSVFYYIWLHLQFVREHEQALLAEQRIQIMISQIQPHFLYNTLSTIQALCIIDPEKASKTVEKFGTYLRQNLDSLNKSDLVPFEKELEHTEIYAEIEMLRFPSISVTYNIEDYDFVLPALTVQPMVENAIRHGVRGLEHGSVTVTVKKGDGFHQILVQDNGKGFDVTSALRADDSHIGIRNVRERIRTLCGGDLEITSAAGRGTSVMITVPDQPESGREGRNKEKKE